MSDKAVFVDPEGNIVRIEFVSGVDIYKDGDTLDGCLIKMVPREADNEALLRTTYYDFSAEQFFQRPPPPDPFHQWVSNDWVLNETEKRQWLSQTINPIRDRLEGGRVVVDGHLIDIDERAEKRMADALELWDALGVTPLPWTLGDNTVLHVDKAQLQRFYDEGRRLRALRSLQLHTEARTLKDNLDTTQEDIDAWETSYA